MQQKQRMMIRKREKSGSLGRKRMTKHLQRRIQLINRSLGCGEISRRGMADGSVYGTIESRNFLSPSSLWQMIIYILPISVSQGPLAAVCEGGATLKGMHSF